MVVVAGKGISAIQFLWRRAARIYPPYWLVSFVVLVKFGRASMGQLVDPRTDLTLAIFLLVPGTTLPLLAVGWTLIHEVYFYLVFAMLLALRIPIPIGLLGWGLVLLVLTLLGGEYVTTFPLGYVWTNPLTVEFMMGAAVDATRLLIALGDWSYATYLTHVLVVSAIGRIIHALAPAGAMASVVLIVVGFLAVNFVGALMFRFFERPTLGLLHRLGSTATRSTMMMGGPASLH